MLEATAAAALARGFPALHTSTESWRRLLQSGTAVRLQQGAHVCAQGDLCSHLALVTSGTARIYKLGESGREITLYRVEAGECCILTASCILSRQPFPAFAVAETELRAVVLPAAIVRDWMAIDRHWRDYLWQLLAERLSEVIGLVEEVAFRRMDRRIAEDLLRRLATTADRASAGALIQATHQQIAADLGTSREVVSRILKDLEARRILNLGRGWIQVQDPKRLERQARAD